MQTLLHRLSCIVVVLADRNKVGKYV